MYCLIVHPNRRQSLLSMSLHCFDLGCCHIEAGCFLKGQVSRQPVLFTLYGIKADLHTYSLSTLFLNCNVLTVMGRNLYILAASITVLAILAGVLSVAHIGPGPHSSGDAALWRTTGIALFCLALIVTLAGTLSSLFEQAERRHEAQRLSRRRNRRQES